jgi:uncharacterized Zn-binding protein involved in type VI secretion
MKYIFSAAVLVLLLTGTMIAQTRTFNGSLRVIGPGSENADIYINELSITVQPDNTARVVMHFKGGSHTEKEDYLDLTGTVSGNFINNELKAKGWINGVLKDGKRIDRRKNYIAFKGNFNGSQLSGNAYVYEKAEEFQTDAFFKFMATEGAELKPALTFPLGKSPKIFNTGWILGASFTIKDAKGNAIDLSDKVKWSGGASYTPSTGKEVRPFFSAIGKNKIILTVEYENKLYKAEYFAEVVNALDYARVGSISSCPADAHGCHACPHHVQGPVITGSTRVLIAGKPAACVGDKGTHAACCGPNTFSITEGDPNILIEGKPVAKIGSATKHCGGIGKIVLLSK